MSSDFNGYPSVDRPWLKYFSSEAINGTVPSLSLFDYLVQSNKNRADRVAINYLGRRITYHDLLKNIDAAAQGFLALGVKEHDIVTIALPSVPEAIYAIYALNRIGAVANMIHPLAGVPELINYLREVGSEVCILFDKTYEIISSSIELTHIRHTVVVSVGNSLPFFKRVLFNLKSKKNVTTSSNAITWREFIKCGRSFDIPLIHKNCNETAIISHTGGTTGDPKGVMCSDRNINSLIWQIDHSVSLLSNGRVLAVLPPFVNYSLVHNMIEGLSFGWEVQLLPKYVPTKFTDYLRKYRPNYIHTIPAYLEVLLKDDKLNNMDLSFIDQMYYGGESMNLEAAKEVGEVLLSHGARNGLCTGLGATELMGAATLAVGKTWIFGSVGAPFPKINCKIVEPGTQTELSYMQEGEICFAGDTVMLGYYNNKSATDEIIKTHSDGLRWMHTGDLGYMNKDGILFVSGRIKRLIMTRDADSQVTKIFPDRVEKVILSCPSVEACCVIGIPDEQYINRPVAVVLLKDEYSPSKETSEQILSVCRDNLPSYMVPHSIEYRDSLPRTERGKVDFRALEEELANS